MAVETEVKIQVDAEEFAAVRERLLGLGAHCVQQRTHESNLLLDFPDGRLRGRGCALRLRTHGGESLLTFKGAVQSDSEFKKRPEIQTAIGDAETVRLILLELGLQASFQYDKSRQIFELPVSTRTVEVCLDETPVGRFVEIEGEPDAIREAASRFGWSADRFIRRSYVELYAEAGWGAPRDQRP